jgi:tetratricopeptide (TPR) repeat protein
MYSVHSDEGRFMTGNPVDDIKSPMVHLWLGMEQPSVGRVVSLVRQTFRLTRVQLIDQLAEASGGTDLGPDESLVFRWEQAGKIGRDRPVPNAQRRTLLAKVCERRLGTLDTPDRRAFLRKLTVFAGVPWYASLLDDLLEARASAERIVEPSPDPTPGSLSVGANRRHIGTGDVDAIRDLSRTLRRLDNKFGGGYAYSMATHHLQDVVVPLLREASYTEAVGRQLYAAGAELAHQVGWMAYDIELHGQARMYLDQALKLAMTAGEDAFSAEILAAMSHQAIDFGRPHDAIDLARTAQASAVRADLPAVLAEAHLMEAHGHARRGDARSCGAALHRGELAFRPSDRDSLPEWLRYFDEAYMAAKFAHCFRDLRDWRKAEDYAQRALDMDDRFVRGRTFNTILLATTFVERDPDEACAIGVRGIELATHLQSSRTVQYIQDLQRRLNERGMPERAVQQFTERVRVMIGETATDPGSQR